MRLATKEDLPRAISVISNAFKTNPSIRYVIKNDKKSDIRIKELAKYSFKTALSRKGAYVSSNERGIALCYRANYKREAYVKSQRPKTGNYLYFWFYRVEPYFNGKGDAKEIKDEIFRMAKDQNLPIYL